MPTAAVPAPGRVTISYPSASGDRERPFRLLVVADLAGGPRPAAIGQRRALSLAQGVDGTMAIVAPVLRGQVPHRLAGRGELPLMLRFAALADFTPAALIAQVPELAAAHALRSALARVRRDGDRAGLADPAFATLDDAGLAAAVADLDRRIAAQVDAILHWPAFQRLEAGWRSLALLAEACRGLAGAQLHLLAASREEIEADLEDAPVADASGLHRQIYGEYGQFGGEPWAVVVSDLAFGPSRRDLALLRRLVAIATLAHAPLLAAAAPELLGVAGWQHLPSGADIQAACDAPALAPWRAFRAGEDARHVALALPCVLLRRPHGADGRGHREDVSAGHAAHLWGSAAFALAARLAAAFAVHGWCSRIAGPAPVLDSPLGIAVETALGEDLADALADAGLVPLVARRGLGDAWFPSARSVRAQPDAATRSQRLATGMEGVMLLDRLAHHLKTLQRERLGAWGDRAALERGLGDWLGSLVVDMDDPGVELLARRPLRSASLRISDMPGVAGWYRVDLEASPHPSWLGARCTLALVARLDRR